MNFDLQAFFETPPRFRTEAKDYIHMLALAMLKRLIHCAENMSISRVLPRHVRLIMIHLCEEPLTKYNKNGICLQQHKMKPMYVLFKKVIDRALEEIENGNKRANIQAKIVRNVTNMLKTRGIKFSPASAVCFSACIAEICGILLHSSTKYSDERTITTNMLREKGIVYKTSHGEICTNIPFKRFLLTTETWFD